jgi:hypothetical protein
MSAVNRCMRIRFDDYAPPRRMTVSLMRRPSRPVCSTNWWGAWYDLNLGNRRASDNHRTHDILHGVAIRAARAVQPATGFHGPPERCERIVPFNTSDLYFSIDRTRVGGGQAEHAGLTSRINDAHARAAVTLGDDSDEYLTQDAEDNHYQNLLDAEIAKLAGSDD